MISRPQPVLTPLTRAAIFLVATVGAGGEQPVLDLLSDLPALQRSVGFRRPEGRLFVVAGIGAGLWDRLYPASPRPAELHPLGERRGDRHRAPSTPGDLLLHIRAREE
ncbi:MAG: Dyp-type peroxidase domain-containing protein, partial [Candidatus Dormibacteraceae bacterium]